MITVNLTSTPRETDLFNFNVTVLFPRHFFPFPSLSLYLSLFLCFFFLSLHSLKSLLLSSSEFTGAQNQQRGGGGSVADPISAAGGEARGHQRRLASLPAPLGASGIQQKTMPLLVSQFIHPNM